MSILSVYGLTDKQRFRSFNRNDERPDTTFFADFMICNYNDEKKRLAAINDTFNRAFEEWKGNYKYLTELVMMLNMLLHYYEEEGDGATARLYNDLWAKADRYACDNLKGEEATYFYDVTD